MNIRKAAGPDDVHPFMIIFGKEHVVKALFILFNTILDKGLIPDIWLRALIVPIPKKKDQKIEVSDFRPISLTSVIAKLFEKIIMRKLGFITE